MDAPRSTAETIFDPWTPFPAQRYRLSFELRRPPPSLPFPGPALRGAFGHTLRQALCITRAPQCEGCALLERCLWPAIFESSTTRGLSTAPLNGWSLAPLIERAPDGSSRFAVEFLLVGPVREHLALFATQLERAVARLEVPALRGARPLGLELALSREALREGFNLRDHRRELPAPPPAPRSATWILHLSTPLRLASDGRDIPLHQWNARQLAMSVRARIQSLLGQGAPRVVFPFPNLAALDGLRLETQRLHRIATHFGSDEAGNPRLTSGYVGILLLRGEPEVLSALWPYFWLAQHLQIGKLTRGGFGLFRLEAAA